MEDKILEKLTNQLKKEMELVADRELKEANKVLVKAKKSSLALETQLKETYDEKIELLKKESKKVTELEARVTELESKLNSSNKIISKLKPLLDNNKFIKKYFK